MTPSVCSWCRTDAASLVHLGWPTCVTCAASRPVRVGRWLNKLRGTIQQGASK